MSNENIQEIIIEHLTDGKVIPDEIREKINSSEELSNYYKEMKQILSCVDNNSDDPPEEYWDNFYNDLEKKLPQKKTKLLRLTRSTYIRNIMAACLLVAIGFYGGQFINRSPNIGDHIQTVQTTEKLKKLLHKSTVVLTSFTSMNEYETHDVLPVNVRISQSLLDETKEIQKEYSNDKSIAELLSELERILTVITSTKGTTPAHVKMVQYGVERRNVIKKIRQAQI